MEGKSQRDGQGFAVLESVRCLDCGTIYTKPRRAGTASSNPGCPTCGYVGWLSVTIPPGAENGQSRSAWDRLHHRSAQSG